VTKAQRLVSTITEGVSNLLPVCSSFGCATGQGGLVGHRPTLDVGWRRGPHVAQVDDDVPPSPLRHSRRTRVPCLVF
jgi:hypothetical protein